MQSHRDFSSYSSDFFLFNFELIIKPSAKVIIKPKPELVKYVTSSPVFIDSAAFSFC